MNQVAAPSKMNRSGYPEWLKRKVSENPSYLEERRKYRQLWYQKNKDRIRAKKQTPQGREKCRRWVRDSAARKKATKNKEMLFTQ